MPIQAWVNPSLLSEVTLLHVLIPCLKYQRKFFYLPIVSPPEVVKRICFPEHHLRKDGTLIPKSQVYMGFQNLTILISNLILFVFRRFLHHSFPDGIAPRPNMWLEILQKREKNKFTSNQARLWSYVVCDWRFYKTKKITAWSIKQIFLSDIRTTLLKE